MISRTLTDLAAPASAPAPVAAPAPMGAATSGDPRTAALLAAARLGIRIPMPGAAPIQSTAPMQAIPSGAGPSAAQAVGQAVTDGVRNAAAPTGPGMEQQLPPTNPNTMQASPQRQAALDALRRRMGGLGMGGQMGANHGALSLPQQAALAARNMTDDRGVFAGQQTGAVMPPYRGQP